MIRYRTLCAMLSVYSTDTCLPMARLNKFIIGATMPRFMTTAAFIILSTAVTQAADLTKKSATTYKPVTVIPAFTWTGFYIGINNGLVRQRSSNENSATTRLRPLTTFGGTVGGTAGYNYQLENKVVLGLEGDMSLVTNRGKRRDNNIAGDMAKISNGYLGTVRGRVGYSFDWYMPYVTAGAAFSDTKISYTSPVQTANFSKNSSSYGFVAGAGVEAQIWKNITGKAEYLYVDLGKQKYGNFGKVRLTDHVFNTSLNYKF